MFETRAHGQHAIWLVTSRELGKRISYARVIPGGQAGTVTITITPSDGRSDVSEVEVTYQLTALTPAAAHELGEFAGRYPAYLQSWQDAITRCLHGQHLPRSHHEG